MSERDEYRKHLFSYRFEGDWYSFDLPAKDADEAQRRLKAIAWAKYDGEIFATIPVPGASFIARIIDWFKGPFP